VGPSMLSIVSFETFFPPANDMTFLPLATVIFLAAEASFIASSLPNLREAGTISCAVNFFVSINLEAFSQVVHPFL